jgi:hypothetical protein
MSNLAARVVRAYLGKSYKVDGSKVRQLLAQYNDQEAREDSQQHFGGYFDHIFELVPLSKVVIDEVWKEAKYQKVVEAIQKGVPLPPVMLSKKGGRFEITDGIHRTNASRDLGFTHIPAIIATWVATPEKKQTRLVKKELEVGTWVKLDKPIDGRSFGWVEEKLHPGKYNIALVKPGDDWPDFVDLEDRGFDPVEPPSWGPRLKAEINS